MMAASLVLLAGGISFFAAAFNARPVKFAPVEAVDMTQDSGTNGAAKNAAKPPDIKAPKTATAPVRAQEKVPDEIQWQPSFAAAMSAAKKSGKPVMVNFYTDWCGYCKKLDSEVYTDFGVISESVNFVSVKVNAEKAPDLAKKYEVDGFPTILWLDTKGTTLERLPGYMDAPGFLEMMRSAHTKASGAI